MFGNNKFKIKDSTAKVVSKEIKKVFNQSVSLPDDLVTNEEIRQTFAKLLMQSHVIPSGPLKTIWKLIEKQVIIPVNVKKRGLLSWLNKILQKSNVPFAYSYDEGTMAFYSGASNRIYMLVDNMLKTNNGADYIAKTVVHELQHMQCHNFPTQFYNVHQKTINSFYYELFGIMCNHELEVNSESCKLFGRYIMYLFDDIFSCAGATITDNDFKSYYDRAAAVYLTSDMKVPKFGLQIANALTQCAESMIDGKFFENAIKNSRSVERYLYQAIGLAYKRIGMNPMKLQSFFGQECIVPSEIIALKPNVAITNDLFAFLNYF